MMEAKKIVLNQNRISQLKSEKLQKMMTILRSKTGVVRIVTVRPLTLLVVKSLRAVKAPLKMMKLKIEVKVVLKKTIKKVKARPIKIISRPATKTMTNKTTRTMTRVRRMFR